MSDILIKGMKMPESCSKCPLSRSGCSAVLKRVKALETMAWIPLNYRHDDCPLIEVHTPHGRLIDADAIEYNMSSLYSDEIKMVSKLAIDKMPTIIEAEGA